MLVAVKDILRLFRMEGNLKAIVSLKDASYVKYSTSCGERFDEELAISDTRR